MKGGLGLIAPNFLSYKREKGDKNEFNI